MNFPVTEITGNLKQSGSVTLDSNGNGTISFSPQHARQRWEVTGVVVFTNQASTAIPVPQATVAVNGVSFGAATVTSPGQSLGSSWSGSKDTFSGQADVGPCDQMEVVFTAGIPGSIAYANLRGTYYTRTA